MLGGAKLSFSYEKISQDAAGLAVLLSLPVWVVIWGRLSVRAVVGIPAFVISEFILGIVVFQLVYRGFWNFVNFRLNGRLRRSSTDEAKESSIRSYAELISAWRAQRV